MIKTQKGKTKQEKGRPNKVEGAAESPATVESVGTAMKLKTITIPIHAQTHKRTKRTAGL